MSKASQRMKSEPRIRHSGDANSSYVETWWYTYEDGKPSPIKSEGLKPVLLPIGLESTITTMFNKMPERGR